MSISYYLACMETHQYVFVGALDPTGPIVPKAGSDAISRFTLAHRNKVLTVVSDTHQIVSDGTDWETIAASAV